jgi:single-strand DNA-binding protein
VTSRLSLKERFALTIHDFRRNKTLVRRVLHFLTNTQAIRILLHEPPIRLAADDKAVVTNMDANVTEEPMNSFTLTAVGNLARNPEAVAKGDVTFTRFCLVGNDYAGKDDEGAPREIVTTLWFVAFGALAESLVRGARKGDQLFVEARVRSNTWTDKQGEKQYDLDFVVQGFRYGAPGKIKREERKTQRQEGMQRADERGNGRDHDPTAIAGSDGGPANGHGSTGNVSADRSNHAADKVNADRSDRGPSVPASADANGRGASGTNGSHNASGVSGTNGSHNGSGVSGTFGERQTEKASEKTSEKTSEKASEKGSEKLVEKFGEKASEKSADKAGEKGSEKGAEKFGERPGEKPVDKTSGSRTGRRAAASPP